MTLRSPTNNQGVVTIFVMEPKRILICDTIRGEGGGALWSGAVFRLFNHSCQIRHPGRGKVRYEISKSLLVIVGRGADLYKLRQFCAWYRSVWAWREARKEASERKSGGEGDMRRWWQMIRSDQGEILRFNNVTRFGSRGEASEKTFKLVGDGPGPTHPSASPRWTEVGSRRKSR